MTGEQFGQHRRRQGLSRHALAALCGLHPDTLRYWERKPLLAADGYAVKRMVDALGLEPPGTRDLGYFRTRTRARYGVLLFPASNEILASRKAPTACSAKTRRGTPCRCRPIPGKRRCKFHGGISTGPKTVAGRQRISDAQKRRWHAYRNAGNTHK